MLRKSFFSGAAALLLAVLAVPAHAAWSGLNTPRGVTTLSGEVYSLHMLIFWIVTVIGIAVFGVMIYSLVHFRRSSGAQPDQKLLHSTRAEILWTAIPVIILVAMAVPAARTLIKIEDASATDINIKVTGYQWKWQYEYLDEGVSFFSTLARDSNAARQRDAGVDPASVPHYLLSVDNPLVVPVGKKVRLLVTSQDVIHSWWVPDLAIKKDAVPGMINEMWFEIRTDKIGVYRGQCTELCGRDHGFMPIVVEALSEADYATWLESKRAQEPESPGATSGAATAAAAVTTMPSAG
jgi:cytochrome c oxidase subunit 2